MRNIKLLIEYDGTNYIGWQCQPSYQGQSIQGILEEGIQKMVRHKVNLFAAGRTDAGVHARGQVANFYTDSEIPAPRFPRALQGILPYDIVVKEACDVPENFHARYHATAKDYRYVIRQATLSDAFDWKYAYHVTFPLNLPEMEKATRIFLGTHDFRSFCAKGSPVKKFVRTVTKAELIQEGNYLYFDVTANGFLYNMVRIMVGTLIKIGRGKLQAEDVARIIDQKDRRFAGPTAPPHGLYLQKVKY
ncbi:MAG: tRNA pseudouridine(38-40) synthase TruA [Dehalobacterium sp.]|jgi:tRNA pseudouridine38-40 synthase